MKKLIGVTGSGAIGIDPLHPETWSGSSRRFFLECKKYELLAKVFGVESPIVKKIFYALRNYSNDKIKWKRQFYMDVGYRNALTKSISHKINENDYNFDFMQIGCMYNLPEIIKGRSRCYSYNDGNFVTSSKSPYFPKNISSLKIQKTIDYEKYVNQSLDMIFTMSEYLRQSFIEDYNISPDKVICVGAGINLDNLPVVDFNKDYSQKNILFIGVDFLRKGGDSLMKAFKIVKRHFPSAILNIVGPSSHSESVPGVHWHGFLRKNHPDESAVLRDLFVHSTLFVMPSVYEPFGIAPLEALAYKIPCIVSNNWSLPEIVQQKKCGELVVPGDWQSLADNIIYLLSDATLLKKYGEAGRSHVENNFTWDIVVNKLRNILTV